MGSQSEEQPHKRHWLLHFSFWHWVLAFPRVPIASWNTDWTVGADNPSLFGAYKLQCGWSFPPRAEVLVPPVSVTVFRAVKFGVWHACSQATHKVFVGENSNIWVMDLTEGILRLIVSLCAVSTFRKVRSPFESVWYLHRYEWNDVFCASESWNTSGRILNCTHSLDAARYGAEQTAATSHRILRQKSI